MFMSQIGQNSGTGNEEGFSEKTYPELPQRMIPVWYFTMRRTMQEIVPNLFLGPYASASKGRLDEMIASGLTHVVCVRQQLESFVIKPNHPNHFQYFLVEFADNNLVSIIPQIRQTNAFIHNALSQGGRVLVHGNAGNCRAPTLMIAYIMAEYGVGQKVALDYVEAKRRSISPNSDFLNQLREFEFILQAEHCNFVTKPLPPMSVMGDPGKRTIDQVFMDNDDEVEADGSVRKILITADENENVFTGGFNNPGQTNDEGAMELD